MPLASCGITQNVKSDLKQAVFRKIGNDLRVEAYGLLMGKIANLGIFLIKFCVCYMDMVEYSTMPFMVKYWLANGD